MSAIETSQVKKILAQSFIDVLNEEAKDRGVPVEQVVKELSQSHHKAMIEEEDYFLQYGTRREKLLIVWIRIKRYFKNAIQR